MVSLPVALLLRVLPLLLTLDLGVPILLPPVAGTSDVVTVFFSGLGVVAPEVVPSFLMAESVEGLVMGFLAVTGALGVVVVGFIKQR